VLVSACVGNVVEWYDFALYGAFATVLAGVFFPSGDRHANLLATFAVFATAFIVRPVGAVLLGRRGDRRGRRQVLALAIILMSVATAGVGALPGHASIGLLAPALLLLFHLVQGLSAGGEAGAASAFVVEYAPANRRGWYGGWIWATLALGLGAGTGAASLLAWGLPPGTLETWGWRLAFPLALPLGLVGLYLRLRLDETPRFRTVQRDRDVAQWPVGEALRAYPGGC
jgi:MFS transporter, MHS family, proline/betaine transporter